MPNELIKNSFNAGEWDPRLDARTDLEKSRSGCNTLSNATVLVQGGAERRPGTLYKGSPKYHDKECRLIPFIYSSETAYHLEFGANYIRFWEMGGAQVMLNGLPYEIYSPYAEADIWSINGKTHSFDVIYLYHPSYHPKKLQRYSETDWRLADLDCKDGPFLPENTDTSLMITPSAVSGTVTLTASVIKGDNTTGTWGGTVTGSWAPFGSYRFTGFKFTAATGSIGFRKVRTYFEAAHATTINTIRCYLYSNSGSSPGTKLATATNTQRVGGDEGAGTRYWYFNDYPITATTVYWVIFESNAAQSAIKQQYVAHSASYGTGSASAITSITDSATTEAYLEITYTKAGTANLFNEEHVGALWRLRHGGKRETKIINNDDTWTSELEIYGKFTVIITSFSGNPWQGRLVLQKSFDSGAIWHDVSEFSLSTRQEFFESKMGVIYRLGCATGDRTLGKASVVLSQSDIWGVCRVTDYTSATVVSATVYSPFGATTATPTWREGAWSDYRGFPQAACFHEDRLYSGGTFYQPTNIWGSWVGEYEKQMPGDTADAALDLLLSSLDNPIQAMKSYTGFLVFSFGEECWLKQPQDKPLTNEQLPKVIVQGGTGCALGMQPEVAGPSLVYVQMHRRKILEILYQYGEDRFKPSDLSRMAGHITDRGIKDIAFAKEPTPLLLAVMDDGTVGALTYYRDEEVLGWSPWDTDGYFESVSVGPSNIGTQTGYSEIWFVVKRTINGATRRFIEVLANNDTVTAAEDFHSVDCGIVYDSTAATTIPGLMHLNGEVVKVLADGVDVSPETVGVADNISDTDYFEDDCSDITIWTDFDANGESTQGTGVYHFAVATPGFSNHAERYIFTLPEATSQDPGRITIQFTLNTTNLPVYATAEYFRIEYDLAEKHLHALISSDGIRVWKGVSLTQVYSSTIANGSDIKWLFDWNTVTEALDIYKNGVKVVTASASCAVSGWSPRGKCFLGLYSNTTSGMTADVSAIKIGSTVAVADGTIRLGTAASVVHAGLSYDTVMETLRIDQGPGPQTVQGKTKSIVKVTPRFLRTLAADATPAVGPSDTECTHDISGLIPSTAYQNVPVDVPVDWKFGSDVRGRVAIKQTSPCPMTLLSLMTELEVGD